MQWFPCALAAFATGGQSTGAVFVPDSSAPTGQNAPAPKTNDDIVVIGRRGAAAVPPETEMDADEIDALGAYDIGEVIDRVAQTKALGG